MNYFTPLSEKEQEDLKAFYYDGANIVGRDRLYQGFRAAHPEHDVSRRAVWNFLERQEVHQLHQRPTIKRGIVRPTIAKKPGSIQIDCLDFSSNPFNGYNTVINCVDIFTKRYWAFPCKGQTVENVIRAMEKWISEGMKCSFLQSDNGSEFKGDFPDWCKQQNITHQYSKAHSPWSNGTIESKGGSFKKMLFQVLKARNTNDWVSITPQIVSNVNNLITFATGKTPLEIEEDTALHQAVGERIQAVANRRYKQKGSPTSGGLQVGDHVRRVLTYDPTKIRKASKAGYYGTEVFEIVSIVKNRKLANVTDSYRIKDTQTGEMVQGLIGRWELLKIPKEMDKLPEAVIHPAPEEGTTDVYEVESILDKRVYRGRTKYLVKWKGYARKDATWQAAKDLSGAKRLVAQYNREHPS